MFNVICYISVIQYFAGKESGVLKGDFGPYKDVAEAEKHLRERGWRQKGENSTTWEIGKSTGDGDAMLALVNARPCKPRKSLPRK